MTARVLVVDDILPNIRLLEARLSADYYEVLTAQSGAEALAICAQGLCDLVLLDVMMPGMDGFEVCARLKADPATAHIPVVMVTALDQPADRVRGLEAGADDFLTKPLDEVALVARVRSLARLKTTLDEWRRRARDASSLGVPVLPADAAGGQARQLIVDDVTRSAERLKSMLAGDFASDVEPVATQALFRAAEGGYDLLIVSLGMASYDPLRLCSQLRSLERTRDLPVLMIADLEDRARILRGLDLGVNDYIVRPIDRNELLARVRTQLRHKLYADALRDSVRASMEMAVVDGLTGLYNRRYLDTHLPSLIAQAGDQHRPLSLMILDIDHFKRINDTFGHDGGDEVLRQLAQRLRAVVRQGDLICRLGGEEFVVVMPDTPLDIAARAAERARLAVTSSPFTINEGRRAVEVTVSAGVADAAREGGPAALYRRADSALYRSKQQGRNRVCADAA